MESTTVTSLQLIKQRWDGAIAKPEVRRWESFLMLCDAELRMLDGDAFNSAALRGIHHAARVELSALTTVLRRQQPDRCADDRVADAIVAQEIEKHGFYSLQQWMDLLGENHPAVKELRATQCELSDAYLELHKIRPAVTAVFDRAVWERARKAGEEL